MGALTTATAACLDAVILQRDQACGAVLQRDQACGAVLQRDQACGAVLQRDLACGAVDGSPRSSASFVVTES